MSTNHRHWPLLAALLLAIVACSPAGAPTASVTPGTGLAITATAGPTCPVERPGDPACAPRPVVGALIDILDAQGTSVAKVVLDVNGSASVALPAGNYVVQAQPMGGLMGTPGPQDVAIVDGAATPVVLAYDTGIR